MILRFIYVLLLLLPMACKTPHRQPVKVDRLPCIYPDYANVTVPVNIAPLNFLVNEKFDQVTIKFSAKDFSLELSGSGQIQIPENRWRKLIEYAVGDTIWSEISVVDADRLYRFKPFYMAVVPYEIDKYLSYRLIEPGYEVWNKVQIVEREMESFRTRVLADNNLLEGSCMNCHISGNNEQKLSMFHLRGKHGGTVVSRNGELKKYNLRTAGMSANPTYGNFHPNGRFAVFSTNLVIPELHMKKGNRLEVYDESSDLTVVDFEQLTSTTSPLINGDEAFETFPVFSVDGMHIYFCSAPKVHLPDSIKQLKYHICRIKFDKDQNSFGQSVDTLWNANQMNGSASLLRTSPDGKFLLFTQSDYGTFPIWHQEADLRLLNLEDGTVDNLEVVNSRYSDTYHSWSSNSRWFVFASKRDDGIYGKPYICYIDANGRASKPFLLPQKNPEIYHNTLKSFNIPELYPFKATFQALDIESVYDNSNAIPLKERD